MSNAYHADHSSSTNIYRIDRDLFAMFSLAHTKCILASSSVMHMVAPMVSRLSSGPESARSRAQVGLPSKNCSSHPSYSFSRSRTSAWART